MLLDLIDLSKLRRAIVYGLVLAALFVLQDLVISQVTLWGVRAMMIPAAVIGISLFEGGVWGGLIGLAAGYFTDIGAMNHVALFTILLAAAGFFAGTLGKYMLHKGFVSYMFLTALALAVIALCQMVPFLVFVDEDARQFHAILGWSHSTWPVWRTAILQVLWSLVWSIPVYFPCKIISSRPMGQ